MARSNFSYPDPQNSATPIANAYGYTSGIGLDLSTGTGRATMNVHRTEASAANRDVPVDQLSLSFGQVLVPASDGVEEVKAATIQEFLTKPVDETLKADFEATPCVGTAWAIILGALDQEWGKLPKLAGSTQSA